MTTKLDDISEAIGSLRAEVRNLGAQIQRTEAALSAGANRADEHRAVIHRRVDDLVGEVGDLKATVVLVEETVKDAKAVTDKVKQWEQRGIGALFVTGIASAAVSGSIVAFVAYWWDSIMKLLRTT